MSVLLQKNSTTKYAETTLSQASANHEAALKTVQTKADTAEKKVCCVAFWEAIVNILKCHAHNSHSIIVSFLKFL